MTDKLKPFDLTAALAGAPVVTRDGRKVLQIAHFPKMNSSHEVIAAIDGIEYVQCFGKSGVVSDCIGFKTDLFMAPVKRTVWVNMYRSDDDLYGADEIFNSKHDAEETAKGDDGYFGTYLIEIEE